jgi:hypothetical protein
MRQGEREARLGGRCRRGNHSRHPRRGAQQVEEYVLAISRRPVACGAQGCNCGYSSLDLRRCGAVGSVMRGRKGVADSLDALLDSTLHTLTRHSGALMRALKHDVPGTIDFPGDLPGERWNGAAHRALGRLIVLDTAVSSGMACQSTARGRRPRTASVSSSPSLSANAAAKALCKRQLYQAAV